MNLPISEYTLCKCTQKYVCEAALNSILQELRFQQKTTQQANMTIRSQQQQIYKLRQQLHQFANLMLTKNKTLNELENSHIDLLKDHQLLIKQYQKLQYDSHQNNKIFEEKSQKMMELIDKSEKLIIQYESNMINLKNLVQQNNIQIVQVTYNNNILEKQKKELLTTIENWKIRYNEIYDRAKDFWQESNNLNIEQEQQSFKDQIQSLKMLKDNKRFRPWQRHQTFRSDFTEKLQEEQKIMISSYPTKYDTKKVCTRFKKNENGSVVIKIPQQKSNFSRETRSKTSYQGKKQYQQRSPKSIESVGLQKKLTIREVQYNKLQSQDCKQL